MIIIFKKINKETIWGLSLFANGRYIVSKADSLKLSEI